MNTINVKIAGHVCELRSEYRFSSQLYKKFRVEELPEFQITLTDMDIDFTNVPRSPIANPRIKESYILRKFSNALLDFDTLLMHGAVVAVDNKSYLFTAPSRTGKSTHIGLWLNYLPNAFVVNGDKPFINFHPDGNIYACGSPWAGKENMYTNTMVPLNSIIYIERAENNYIEQISFSEAFPLLLQQVYRPENKDMLLKTLRLIKRLHPMVSFYRFQCNNFKDDCFHVAYKALIG